MLSIQYLLFTPKCVSCSKVEIFTHSWTRYTVSKTPQKHEDERNYCISFRQSYFQHWSINVWSPNEWTLWQIQRNMTEKKGWSLIEENLGLATRFPQVRAALARSTNLEAIEDILKQRHHYFETILTPRAGISMDVKLFFSRKSLSTLSLCVGVRLLDVESVEFEGGIWTTNPHQ